MCREIEKKRDRAELSQVNEFRKSVEGSISVKKRKDPRHGDGGQSQDPWEDPQGGDQGRRETLPTRVENP